MREPGQSDLLTANLRQHKRRLRNGSITHSLAGMKVMFTTASQKRQTRERLNTCLAELGQIRRPALLGENVLAKNVSFRAGLPCFERTLELFHRLSRCNLDHVPFADLKNITDDAANTVDQFRKIVSFTGENVENSREARDLLIDEVDASFPHISTNFAIVVSQPPRRQGGFVASTSAALTIGFCTLVFALAAVAYYSAHDGTVADKILSAVHRIRSL
jgi:hypothetical protein